MNRRAAVLVFSLVFVVRGAYLVSLSRTPLALWHLWSETDEWGYVDWSAHLAAGNWRDVPAWRSYYAWQEAYGSQEEWEEWYQKNAYFSGPLYPYGLAVLRLAFGSPVWPARLLQMLLACLASAALAAAVQRVSEDFLRVRRKDEALREARSSRAAAWAGVAAGVLYGLYAPLVFHDGFLLRDGPVAHLSTLLLALPLVMRGASEENGGISSNEDRGKSMRAAWAAILLGLLGGAAVLMKQTALPLALVSLYSVSKDFPGGRERGRSLLFGLLGLALPLGVLAVRNVSAGVPPLTFDTRQAVGLVWGNAEGADGSNGTPDSMGEILADARGSTLATARLVLRSYEDAPLELPKLFLKKLATFFNAYEVPDNANFYFFRDRLPLLKALPVFPCLLGAGLVGLFAARARGVLRREEGLLAAVAIVTPLAACLLVHTTSRFRAAMAGPLALGAGLFFFFLFDEIRIRRRVRKALILATAAGVLSLIPLLPSVIPAGRHRFSDTLVYATLVEAREGPDAAAAEVERYLAEGGDDDQYDVGVKSLAYWLESGDRSNTLVEPAGVAPPERRVKKKE